MFSGISQRHYHIGLGELQERVWAHCTDGNFFLLPSPLLFRFHKLLNRFWFHYRRRTFSDPGAASGGGTSVAPILGIILVTIVGLRERKTIAVKVTLQMFVAALFGIPIGTAILVGVNPAVIKIIVGSIVVCFTLAIARGLPLPTSREFPLSLAAGFLSGILSGISGMSVSMAVIFFMSQGLSPVCQANPLPHSTPS